MKPRLGVIALGLSSSLALGCGDRMEQGIEQTHPDVVHEDELGLLVTPAELVSLGASAEQIAAQTRVFEQMSDEELAKQEALRASQEQLAKDLKNLPDLPGTIPSPVNSSGSVSPMIRSISCWPDVSYYKVFWSGSNVACFADGGTMSVSYENTTAVRPGNNVGRIWYSHGSTQAWSPYRGKSSTTYYFNGPVHALKVQIN